MGLDTWLIDMLKYGFPLQYIGRGLTHVPPENHSSAKKFPKQVQAYIDKELREGALAGPFAHSPFESWDYTNPIMTRPKADGNRRIIVDLSHPKGAGVNSAVIKGMVFGNHIHHVLPTVQQAIAIARSFGFELSAGVIDIERAYRNFRSDPLDWPLLMIQAEGHYFVDLALPFGARLSSLYVQQLAEFIVRVLAARGITALVYLDDVYLLFPAESNSQSQFAEAMYIIRTLGLPINYGKLIPPSTRLVWLGVQFDFIERTVSIPQYKVDELTTVIRQFSCCQHITYQQTQSIIGRIAHIARVIPPARVFMARILAQLRDSDGSMVYINHGVLSDFRWFLSYFARHNATSMMGTGHIRLVIQADSSLEAGGAFTDDGRCYIYEYSPNLRRTNNICQLEALNYLLAVRTFVDSSCKGASVELIGDNMGAISALNSGRGTDAVLCAIARALWFHSAKTGATVKFTHKPGEEIPGADILSRACLSREHRLRAQTFIADNCLIEARIYPAYLNYNKYL